MTEKRSTQPTMSIEAYVVAALLDGIEDEERRRDASVECARAIGRYREDNGETPRHRKRRSISNVIEVLPRRE
jgi:hypothetical protein